ncbi:trypsin-like peptidase domain-containing protein [Pseudonocardia alaniniphila]|uniref:trypsin-like peptidase domain-containing protein n=1 Tax=Pseudonocardia alaniniphila TaxID=75291 RepID=UPI0031E05ECC
MAAVENGRPAAGIYHMAGASTLGRVGSALSTSARAGSVIQQGGIFGRTVHIGSVRERVTAAHPVRIPGLLSTMRAHSTLGLPFGRVASPRDVEVARQNASLAARGIDLPTAAGRPTSLDRVVGRGMADRIRQNRIAKAHDVVLKEQVLRGGMGRGRPALLSGADVSLAQRAATDQVLARSTPIAELTPAQLAELSGVSAREISRAGCRGVCVVEGLNRDVTANGGAPDGVMFGRGGRIYVDAQVMGALRDGRLAPDALAELVRHQTDGLSSRGRANEDLYSLPDLSPLADDVAASYRGASGTLPAGTYRAGARTAQTGEMSAAHGPRAAPTRDGTVSRGGADRSADLTGASRSQSQRPGQEPPPRGPGTNQSQPVSPAVPTGERAGGARPQGSGGGPDPLPAQPGTSGGPRLQPQETSPVPTRDGHQTMPDPTAGELNLPPPGTRYTLETPGGSRVTIEIVARPERSSARVEALQRRVTDVESQLRDARTEQGEAVRQDVATNRQLNAERVRLQAELDRLRQPTDARGLGATDVPGLHHREVGPPVEVAPGVTVRRVEVSPQREASRAQRMAAVEARLSEIQAALGDRSATAAAGARIEALETQLDGLRHQLAGERAALDTPGLIDLDLPLGAAGRAGVDPPVRKAPAEMGESLPEAPTAGVRQVRWHNVKAVAKELFVKVVMTSAVVGYSLIPHTQGAAAHVPQVRSPHVAVDAATAARSASDGPLGPARARTEAPAPRTTETGNPTAGVLDRASRPTTAADGTTGVRPVADTVLDVPRADPVAAGARAATELGPDGVGARPAADRQSSPDRPAAPGDPGSAQPSPAVPLPSAPVAPTVSTGPVPVWDRRLQDVDGRAHIRLFGQNLSVAETRRPGEISAAEWATYTPAQRAEAWYAAADAARHQQQLGELSGAIADLGGLQQSLDRRIRTFERETAVIRAKAGLPTGRGTAADRGRRPEVSWQHQAEQAVAELAQMREERAAVQARRGDLERQRAELVAERDTTSWLTTFGAPPGLQDFAAVARGYGDMHRTIAESSRGGRRQLAQVERYRERGYTSVQVRDAVWAQRLGRRLLHRAPAAVAGDLQRFVAAGDRAALMTMMTAGLAGELGDKVLARFAARHGLPWGSATRAELLAGLPTTMKAAWRATQPPRNAAWEDTANRNRAVFAWGAGATVLSLLGGGVAILGTSGAAAVMTAGLGAAAVSAAVLHLVPQALRIRGPPAVARMVAAAAGLSAALLTGVPALAGAGATTPAVMAGATAGAVLFAARGITASVSVERTTGLTSRLVRVAVHAAVVVAIAAPLVAGVAAAASADTATAVGTPVASLTVPQALTVQRRDVLSRLAAGLGVSEDTLAAANSGRFPTAASRDDIEPGERLRIPAVWNGTWTVQRGENLTVIAARWGIGPDALADAQGTRFATVAGRDHIDVGERFVAPGSSAASKPGDIGRPSGTPTPAPSATPTPSTSPTPSATPTTVGTPRAPPGPGLPWTTVRIGGLIVLSAVAAFFGVRAVQRHWSTIRGRPAALTGRWHSSRVGAWVARVPAGLRDAPGRITGFARERWQAVGAAVRGWHAALTALWESSRVRAWAAQVPGGLRDARGRVTDVVRERRETIAATRRRWAAARTLRSVMSGLDDPVADARSGLGVARAGVASADTDLARLQRSGVRWLYDGPGSALADRWSAAARDEAVARMSGIDPAEVRLFAVDATAPSGATGLGEPAGTFQERQERLAAELATAEARLRDAAGRVDQAGRALVEREAERLATLEAAVRAAAGDGLRPDRIAAISGLSAQRVREIVGDDRGPGSGPSASGGGPGSGTGGPNPLAGGPERRSAPPAGSNGVAESRASGPRKAGPQPRSRGPPWRNGFFPGRRMWTVVLLTGGLVASLAAVRYGVVEPGVLAAGMVWWPGQRKATKQLREKVADARVPLVRAEQAEALLQEVVRRHEQELGERLGWVPVLAERLRGLGRTDDEIVEGLADALGAGAVRVRARLADPALAEQVSLPPALEQAVADTGLSPEQLFDAARNAVTRRSSALSEALAPLDGAARQVATARIRYDEQTRAAAVAARNAGVRAGPVRRATGLNRVQVTELQAHPPTLRDAARAVRARIVAGWRAARHAMGVAGDAVLGATRRVGQRGVDRWRAARVLRSQVRAVAQLRAVAGSTARLLHREQRAAERKLTTEQLGWIGWLVDVNPAGQPDAQLVQRLGKALGLPEKTARRLVARARGLDATQVGPPPGKPASGVHFEQAVAAVGAAFAEAFPGLAGARAAHQAAGRALSGARDRAGWIVADAGVTRARADRRLDRAARGRGWAGYRNRLRTGLGLDVPVAERHRPRLAGVAGLGIGAGVGLWGDVQLGVVGAGAVTGPIGLVVAAAGLIAAVRAVWTPRQTRGPPWRAFTRGMRTHGVRIGVWLAGGLAAGMAGPTVWGLVEHAWSVLWPVFSQQPGLSGIKALLVPLVSAGLVYRYVLRRQYANQGSGMQTRPRRAASVSAVLAYVASAGLGLTKAFASTTLPWWLVPVAMAIGAGIAGAIAQQKDLGRTRVIKSVVTGALSAAVAFVVSRLAGGVAPGALADLVNAVAVAILVYAAPTVIAEYVNDWVGRFRAPKAKRKAKQEQKNSAESTGSGDRQRRLFYRWLDYKNFSPVDTRLLFRKAMDPVLAGLAAIAINLSWVSKTWVDTHDSLAALLTRFAVAAVTVWAIGKLIRDPDEYRAGYYGYRGSRELRSPSRPMWWPWRNRLHKRAADYRKDLDALLERFGLNGALDRDLAERLAERVWERISAEIHLPLDEWEPLPETTKIRRALGVERGAAARRREHHVETIKLVAPVLAADPAALDRVADQLRRDGRTDDARIVTFQRMFSQALLAEAGMATPPAASRIWTELLAEAVTERSRLRAEYLAGPRRALLEVIKQYYLNDGQPKHRNLRRARAALRALRFELQGLSTPRREPLEAVAQLADQRSRSAAETADTEQRALAAREAGATVQRLREQRELAAAMRLLRSAALVGVEVELSTTHRKWNKRRWRDAMATATASTAPNAAPATLLERLLMIAGRRGPVTAARLVAQYGGTGWDEALAALTELNALQGDPARGYRADPALATLWKDAGPRLRHAVRANPLVLPGGAELAPLTGELLGPAGLTQAEKDAYSALREILHNGDLAFRRSRDGWIDDVGIWRRRLTGMIYLLRHSAGRRDWPLPADHPAAPVRFVTRIGDVLEARWRHAVVPGRQRHRLQALLRATDPTDRLYFRVLRASWLLADQRDGSLPNEAIMLLHAARGTQVVTHTALAEARKDAAARLDAVGSYPHQIDRTLRAAEAHRALAPGADPLPPAAEHWLREITKELDAFRKRLNGLHSGPARERVLDEARLSLARYEIDEDYAWETRLFRTAGGWSVMDSARKAAKRLRTEHPDLFREKPAPAVGHSPVIPDRDFAEHPYGDEIRGGIGVAAATLRGRGNRTNQDAATIVTLPNGDRVAAVVDGVFSYPDSTTAANRFAIAFHDEIVRPDRAGRSPEETLRAAHDAGAAALVEAFTPETGHGAVAYVAAYHGTDGTITIIHVGTSRAYYLPEATALSGAQLTSDDSRPGPVTSGGTMTGWVAGDRRPGPTVTTFRPSVAGLLVLATDGLWRYLPTPGDLAAKLDTNAYTDATEAVTYLSDAARLAGGLDDLTVAAMPNVPPAVGTTSTPPSASLGVPAGVQASTPPAELSQHERTQWADRLEAVLAELPDGFDRQALLMDVWLIDAARILRGDWDPAWPRPPPVAVHRGAPGGHQWVGDALHIVASDPVQVLPALVEEVFAPWWGFSPAQARVIAALARRAVSGDRMTLPVDEATRRRLNDLFADHSEWRVLAAAWADDPAVAAAARAGAVPLSGPATGHTAGRLIGITTPRPNLRPENYPVEVRLAGEYDVVRTRLDSVGAAAIVRVQPEVKGVVDLGGRIWIVPATLPDPGGQDPEFSHAVAAAGHDVQLAFTAWLALDQGRVVVERVTAHSGHYNAGNTDAQNEGIVEALHHAFALYGIGAAPGRQSGGGPVAAGGMDSRARGEVIARLPVALRGGRPLSGEEFPHLARGPPEGVALVRIVEDDLGDGGSLIAFGRRDAEHAPDGVIAVPARVARVAERLIAADPAFGDWWARLLRHELDFHIDGDEHTGQRHDTHAAALAAEYDAARRPIRTMTGGPSLISHGSLGADDHVTIEHRIDGLPVVEELAAGDPDLVRISGFTGQIFLRNPANGLRALDGLIEATQAVGIRGGLVVWASRDGWLYTDARVLAALRADVLDLDARRALFDHELLHLSEPGLAESVIQDAAPLPDLTPLSDLYRDPAGFPVPAFRPVVDAYGRPAWLAPELGVAPGILSRVVRIVIHASDGYEHVGSGVLWSSDGRTGVVLTNRHVVADAEQLRVELSTPAGVRSVPGSVGRRPAADAIAAELRASGAAGALTDAELVQAADVLDLAIVHIAGSRRLAAPDLDRDGRDPRVTLIGFPRRQLPARSSAGGVDNLRTEAQHLVIGAGLTARPPAVPMGPARKFDLFFVGPWAGPGNSGGPLITRTRDDEGALVERVAGLYHARIRHKRIRTPIQAAVGAVVIEAFLRAAGVPDAGQGGGAVARHPLTDSQREQVVEALRASDERMTPLEELTPAMPRAPPGVSVLVRDGEFPAPDVVAFGWAERGAVVITRSTATQIAARYAVDPDGVQRWWDRLLTHEVEFHLGEHPEHTGPRHDADAAPIAGEWFVRPVTARRPSAGLRKPHGSEIDAWFTGSLLTGDEMTMVARRELADRLEQRLNRTRPPASAAEQAGLLREMVQATLRLLRREPMGERWREVAPTRLYSLADMPSGRLVDTILGSAADAGHAERDGVREVFARDEVGLLHEVVKAALAPAAGFRPAQAHVLAVLAERLVDGPDRRGERWRARPGWLTARAEAELSELAVRNPPARVLLVWTYEQVRAEISSRFAQLPEWRELALRYAAEFHAAAIEEARVPTLSEVDLRSEYDGALAGLRQLVAGDKSLTWRQRRSLSQALRKAEREAGGPHRWEIEVDLRSLRVLTERAGVWPTDPELVYLAVRNVTWGRHTDSPQLAGVRWQATKVLSGTASPELSLLLRPERQYGGSTRLFRFVIPADLRSP